MQSPSPIDTISGSLLKLHAFFFILSLRHRLQIRPAFPGLFRVILIGGYIRDSSESPSSSLLFLFFSRMTDAVWIFRRLRTRLRNPAIYRVCWITSNVVPDIIKVVKDSNSRERYPRNTFHRDEKSVKGYRSIATSSSNYPSGGRHRYNWYRVIVRRSHNYERDGPKRFAENASVRVARTRLVPVKNALVRGGKKRRDGISESKTTRSRAIVKELVLRAGCLDKSSLPIIGRADHTLCVTVPAFFSPFTRCATSPSLIGPSIASRSKKKSLVNFGKGERSCIDPSRSYFQRDSIDSLFFYVKSSSRSKNHRWEISTRRSRGMVSIFA